MYFIFYQGYTHFSDNIYSINNLYVYETETKLEMAQAKQFEKE